MRPRRTDKQKHLMGLILLAASNGKFLNIKELHEAADYGASYGAIRVSLKFLESKGMIEKRRRGYSTDLVPTQLGYDWFRPARL